MSDTTSKVQEAWRAGCGKPFPLRVEIEAAAKKAARRGKGKTA